MMQKRFVIWILSASLLVGASLAQAQGVSRNVTGKVVDRNGEPVAQAQVRFDGPPNYVSRTKSDGTFFLREIRNGTYRVVVKRDRRAQNFTVKISNGIYPEDLKVNW